MDFFKTNMRDVIYVGLGVVLGTNGYTRLTLGGGTIDIDVFGGLFYGHGIFLGKGEEAIGRGKNRTTIGTILTNFGIQTIIGIGDSKGTYFLYHDFGRYCGVTIEYVFTDAYETLGGGKYIGLLYDANGALGGLRVICVRDASDMTTFVYFLGRFFYYCG